MCPTLATAPAWGERKKIMRLIDADVLIEEFEMRVRTTRSTMEIIRDVIPLVQRQKTVYDVDKIVEELKKQIPKKIKVEKYLYGEQYHCPVCGNYLDKFYILYCEKCGQRLEW